MSLDNLERPHEHLVVDLPDTNSSTVASVLLDSRRRSGSPAVGMVLTLIVVSTEDEHDAAANAATQAAREHPCRILSVIPHGGRQQPRMDAEVAVGGDVGLLESVVFRLYGSLRSHLDSVVMPLLLPDTPVVVWWPGTAPADVGGTSVGALAQRRVTDAASAARSGTALARRASTYRPGDTDLAWTRLTPWRTLLASALDKNPGRVRGGAVSAARGNASAELLAGWLGATLDVPVERHVSRGPGITSVSLTVPGGTITIDRPDGRLATLNRPGDRPRRVALQRRSTPELLAEELRRLDPDEIYEKTLAACTRHAERVAKKTQKKRDRGAQKKATGR